MIIIGRPLERALKLNESRLETVRPLEPFGRLTRRAVERFFPGTKVTVSQEEERHQH